MVRRCHQPHIPADFRHRRRPGARARQRLHAPEPALPLRTLLPHAPRRVPDENRDLVCKVFADDEVGAPPALEVVRLPRAAGSQALDLAELRRPLAPPVDRR